eukprot:m.15741 g.15741  ORF g.15741 m.15741 type:complete len:150 (+) comp10807_c0_seq2:96-545(+)
MANSSIQVAVLALLGLCSVATAAGLCGTSYAAADCSGTGNKKFFMSGVCTGDPSDGYNMVECATSDSGSAWTLKIYGDSDANCTGSFQTVTGSGGSCAVNTIAGQSTGFIVDCGVGNSAMCSGGAAAATSANALVALVVVCISLHPLLF